MLLLTGAVLGALAGRLAGGSIWNLAAIRFRWPLVVIAAVAVRELALFTPLGTSPLAPLAYVISLWMLIAWTLWHRDRLRGIWIVSVGMAMNLLVIAANAGHMTIPASLVIHTGGRMGQRLLHDHVLGQYVLASKSTHLNWLGDIIALPGVIGRLYPQAYSAGDLVAFVGVFLVLFLAVCPHLLLNRRQVPVDARIDGDSVVVTASLPGFAAEEVEVDAAEKVLTLRASHAVPPPEQFDGWVRRERFSGDVQRRISLPARVDAERASATVANGVLRVKLPLQSRASSRPVPVAASAPAPAPAASENGTKIGPEALPPASDGQLLGDEWEPHDFNGSPAIAEAKKAEPAPEPVEWDETERPRGSRTLRPRR